MDRKDTQSQEVSAVDEHQYDRSDLMQHKGFKSGRAVNSKCTSISTSTTGSSHEDSHKWKRPGLGPEGMI